jgi:4-diphosphocytidyl-2-C-methyl-D-erythritol kinase
VNAVELSEKAWAKINLGLKVLGARPDGYHDICSVFQTVDLADVLHFRQGSENRLSCSDASLPTNDTNLALKALRLFQEQVGAGGTGCFDIHLEKKIPVGSGLGGGSADAAAVLRAMNRSCGGLLSYPTLRALAQRLGSDVPFLINGGCAVVRGRGEEISPISAVGNVTFVLAYPGVRISSAWAYSVLPSSLTVDTPYLNFVDSLSGGCVDLLELCSTLENDFQPMIERAYPIVADLSKTLSSSGARFLSMSGSGSCLFGVFEDRTAASSAVDQLQAQGFRSFLCRPVGL